MLRNCTTTCHSRLNGCSYVRMHFGGLRFQKYDLEESELELLELEPLELSEEDWYLLDTHVSWVLPTEV